MPKTSNSISFRDPNDDSQTISRRMKKIILIRHGESLGNVARHSAERNKAATIDFPCREPDIALSNEGEVQALRLGKWLATADFYPSQIFSSPYLRTRQTLQIILANLAGKLAIPQNFDERLRERELGVFDCLTKIGAQQKYPDLAEMRERWGKFYFRPPGGESWADVITRLHSFIDGEIGMLTGDCVWIITHEVVIRLFRYIFEGLSEEEVLKLDANGNIENGSITCFEYDTASKKYRLTLENFVP